MKKVVLCNGSYVTVLRQNRKTCTAYNYCSGKLTFKFILKVSDFNVIVRNRLLDFGFIVLYSNFDIVL